MHLGRVHRSTWRRAGRQGCPGHSVPLPRYPRHFPAAHSGVSPHPARPRTPPSASLCPGRAAGQAGAGARAELTHSPLPPHSRPHTGWGQETREGKGTRCMERWPRSQPLPFPCSPPLPQPLFPEAAAPHPLGGWRLSRKNPGVGASIPTSGTGRRELGSGPKGEGSSDFQRPSTPTPASTRGPRGGGGRGAGLEDRTSSWQDIGRQAGGSQPQSRPRGERSLGPGAHQCPDRTAPR